MHKITDIQHIKKHSINFLTEFIKSYGIILLAILILLNILFYLVLPEDYLAFIFNEAVIALLLWLSHLVGSLRKRIEIERLRSLDELYNYYLNKAGVEKEGKEKNKSEESPFRNAYNVLIKIGKSEGLKWIPGVIEKFFIEGSFVKPVVFRLCLRDRKWIQLFMDIVRPYEDKFKEILKSIGWNELKVRPIGIRDTGLEAIIEVEPTPYYYSIITNFSCDLPIGRNKSLRDILEPLILVASPKQPLRTIEESKDLPISNHVGINILIVTKNGDLLLSERSSFVAVEQHKIGHTVAGSLDWKTLVYLASNKGNKIALKDVILQELAEKEEISSPKPEDYKFYPIALTRNLRFLGKPDIQLIGISRKKTEEILKYTVTGKKAENIRIIRIRLKDKEINVDFKKYKEYEIPCDVLELIYEKVAEPLLQGRSVEGEYVGSNTPTRITYDKLSANLILGLYAYLKAYMISKTFCNNRKQR